MKKRLSAMFFMLIVLLSTSAVIVLGDPGTPPPIVPDPTSAPITFPFDETGQHLKN